MAKKRAAHLARYQFQPRASAPIVIRTRSAPAKKVKHRRSGGSGSSKKRAIHVAIAGFVLGHVDKAGTSFPTVPMLGRAGTIAAFAYFFGKGQGIWGDVLIAAASVAGYEFGSTGKIAGDVTPQISGVASQF